jgi:hypothetical protein
MLVTRSQVITDGAVGDTAIGVPITEAEAGIARRVYVTISPLVSGAVVDAGITDISVWRGPTVLHRLPVQSLVYRDVTTGSDYAAPLGIAEFPVNWDLRAGDILMAYIATGNGMSITIAMDIQEQSSHYERRDTPSAGDGRTDNWASYAVDRHSDARWQSLRYLLGHGVTALYLLLVAALLPGCATNTVVVRCSVQQSGTATGSVTLQCNPATSPVSVDGEIELQLPADALRAVTRPADQRQQPTGWLLRSLPAAPVAIAPDCWRN